MFLSLGLEALKIPNIFFTGLGGVLYPPNSLDIRVLNEEKFSMLCPSGDDIWFWGHALLKGTKIKLMPLVRKPFKDIWNEIWD